MYRIVHNELTGKYRVEKHGLLGWNFVTDPQSGDYLDFEELAGARDWICARRRPDAGPRRWREVSDCDA